MKISSVEIDNFRGIKHIKIPFDDMIILIGSNGTGKTTLLDAIAIFFSKKNVDRNDFYKNKNQPIKITIEFSNINSKLQKYFSNKNIIDNVITKTISKNEKMAPEYSALKLQHTPFVIFETLQGKYFKDTYQKFCSDGYDLSDCTTQADMKRAMKNWEINHKNKCEQVETKITRDFLEHFNILRIEAAKEPSIDVNEGNNSILTESINFLVRASPNMARILKKYKKNTMNEFKKIKATESFSTLNYLSSGITKTIQEIDKKIEINIEWNGDQDITIPIPTVEAKIKENNSYVDVNKAGDGSQRLFLYGIMRFLNNMKTKRTQNNILLIDEPELHQHPIRREAFYDILKKLSKTSQIVYATHSQKFISLTDLPKIRFFKMNKKGISFKKISFKEISDLAKKIERKSTPKLVEQHLSITDTSYFRESLFSNTVVLVEGITDKLIIEKVAKNIGKDFVSRGISVVSCDGKSNLREQIILFKELNINVYVIWDLDMPERKLKKQHHCNCCSKKTILKTNKKNTVIDVKRNKKIYKYMGVAIPEKFKKQIKPTFACFHGKIEDSFTNVVDESILEKYKTQIITPLSLDKFNKKNSYILSKLIDKIYESDSLPLIERIVNKIIKLNKSKSA